MAEEESRTLLILQVLKVDAMTSLGIKANASGTHI